MKILLLGVFAMTYSVHSADAQKWADRISQQQYLLAELQAAKSSGVDPASVKTFPPGYPDKIVVKSIPQSELDWRISKAKTMIISATAKYNAALIAP